MISGPIMIGPVMIGGLVSLIICSFILEASHISAVFHDILSSGFSFSFSIGVESFLVRPGVFLRVRQPIHSASFHSILNRNNWTKYK